MFTLTRSPLTYGMVGHLKTVLILAGGYLIFDDNLNRKQTFGILLTLFGLLFYTFAKQRECSDVSSRTTNTQDNLAIECQADNKDSIVSVK